MGSSEDELAGYWADGFLLLPGLFDRETLARLESRFVELATGAAPAPSSLVVMRDVMVAQGAVTPETPLHAVNKILSFEEDEVLFSYALNPGLLERVRELIGPDVMTLSTNVFNKPPGVDGRHPLHQDLRYFSFRPEDQIVATWTAISPMRVDNGCLAVVPGSHRRGLLPHGTPQGWEYVNGGFFAAEGVDLEERVHLEMEPGDTLLFHPLLLHGSGRNRSGEFRRAISTHYAATTCERPPPTRRRDAVIRRIPAAAASAKPS